MEIRKKKANSSTGTNAADAADQRSRRNVFKIVVAACSVFLVLLIVALIINLVRLGAARERLDALRAQEAQLDSIIEDNGSLIDYCSSPEFIESYAREYFDMIYRGEIPIDVE